MGESSTHTHLVRSMLRWVSKEFEVLGDGVIYTDLSDQTPQGIPPLIYGYRPDLYAKFGKIVVIGEAKTPKDLDRRHSLEQYRAFFRYCSSEDESAIILAVPWQVTRLGRNILKAIQNETNAAKVNIFVIEQLAYTE